MSKILRFRAVPRDELAISIIRDSSYTAPGIEPLNMTEAIQTALATTAMDLHKREHRRNETEPGPQCATCRTLHGPF